MPLQHHDIMSMNRQPHGNTQATRSKMSHHEPEVLNRESLIPSTFNTFSTVEISLKLQTCRGLKTLKLELSQTSNL